MVKKIDYSNDLKDSGDRRNFDTGAIRDVANDKGRMDLLPACAVIRLAKHFQNGANKYDERNWEKGIPMSVFLDSGSRHLLKYLDGQIDEDHLVAAAWNIMCAMWTEEKLPEMQDIPARIKAETILRGCDIDGDTIIDKDAYLVGAHIGVDLASDSEMEFRRAAYEQELKQ